MEYLHTAVKSYSLSVCVFLYMLQSEDQNRHLTYIVRTFWLVLTKVRYRIKNWFREQLRLTIGLDLKLWGLWLEEGACWYIMSPHKDRTYVCLWAGYTMIFFTGYRFYFWLERPQAAVSLVHCWTSGDSCCCSMPEPVRGSITVPSSVTGTAPFCSRPCWRVASAEPGLSISM